MFLIETPDFAIDYKSDLIVSRDCLFRHVHDYHELHFTIKGNGTFVTDNASCSLHGNDIFIIPAGVYHYLEPENSNSPYERLIFAFTKNKIDGIDISQVFDSTKIANISSHYEIIRIFKELINYHETITDKAQYEDFARALVHELLVQLKYFEFANANSKSVNDLTFKIISFVDNHLLENISVDTISDALYVSKSHLQNTFLKSMKIGIKSYIIMKKMTLAHTMLQNGERATSVSNKLGYSTYSCFYKSYLKIYGVPPKDTK